MKQMRSYQKNLSSKYLIPKQFEEISKEAEKNLSEKELEMVKEFKEKAKTLKSADFSSLMELKKVYENKLNNGV